MYFLLAVISISVCQSVLPSLKYQVNCEIIGAEPIALAIQIYINDRFINDRFIKLIMPITYTQILLANLNLKDLKIEKNKKILESFLPLSGSG